LERRVRGIYRVSERIKTAPMIKEYFMDFDTIINSYDFIVASDIKKRAVNDFLGIIEGVITLECGKLDILEVVKVIENNLSKMKYKYNFSQS